MGITKEQGNAGVIKVHFGPREEADCIIALKGGILIWQALAGGHYMAIILAF